MFEVNVNALIKSIAIALVFFVVGRWIVIQMGDNGIWAIVIMLVVFYAGWWVLYQRNKSKK